MKRKQEKLGELAITLESDLNDEEKNKKIKDIMKGKIEKMESAKVEPVKNPGRNWTLSLAFPGSILDNAQSPELRYSFYSINRYSLFI